MTPERDAYLRLGKTLTERHSDQLAIQLSVFQSALINFGVEHGDAIRNNAEFRHKFTQMCALIGVDPLELLIMTDSRAKKTDGFFVGLGVRMVEICQETRNINGGLISFKELHSRLQESVSVPLAVSEADAQKALDSLVSLGKGYETLSINNKQWIKFLGPTGSQSISNDQKKVYELCEFMGGHVTYRLLRDNFGWDKVRTNTVVDEMIMNGFLWVDAQGPGGATQFWEPSWISKTE
ncbi:winged helix DNA-binding domain-containing protein [Metschnikowia bicuspidata var. bicuspidata NRRL YB-4993]|uniref:Winged helix DNA-binding domain-containing protein n=1 Tax=Metschnikowia bicuspidata var. bicuspidata NRRL YB-4993 TaxID=869754 RepID=A0A1A0H829_9ASCO|nr:winged helix DNA-binding domain-containing protein [Metschnikowia bicuspidata var. bicuspidata NRRL YB-4993]OBA20176.1 winged helix DNA-binding domain-containing protein [Metschnikowia bicuspidata var. bicuspidata NRRL YB-4993]